MSRHSEQPSRLSAALVATLAVAACTRATDKERDADGEESD